MILALTARLSLLGALLFGAGQALSSPAVDPDGILIDVGIATHDTRSGRQWLDLTASRGQSYNDMKITYGCDPTCTRGPYAGWTFAQAGDVRQLVEDAGVPYGVDLLESPGPAGFIAMRVRLDLLITFLGGSLNFQPVFCDPACGGVHGILNRILTEADLAGPAAKDPFYPYPPEVFAGLVQQASIADIACCGDLWAGDSLSGPAIMGPYPVAPVAESVPAHSGDSFFTGGVWLYRVPEPSTLALTALALLLAGPGRRVRRPDHDRAAPTR